MGKRQRNIRKKREVKKKKKAHCAATKNINCEKLGSGFNASEKKSAKIGMVTCGALFLAGVGEVSISTAAAQIGAVSPNEETSIEEITVTARLREERIQDVPISVTALTGEKLRFQSITETTDLYKISPSLTINPAATRLGTMAVRIRSLVDQSASNGQDSTVAVYFADAIVNRQHAFRGALFDIETVQVLKGPQGTLFGRSSTAGALLIDPKRPSDRFEGHIDVTYGQYNRRELEGVLNLPLATGLALRIAAKSTGFDGNILNEFDGSKINEKSGNYIRGGLSWAPTENLKTYFLFDYAEFDGSPSPTQAIDYRPGSPGALFFPSLPGFIQDQREKGRAITSLNSIPFVDAKNIGVTNITEVELGGIRLKNILNFRHAKLLDNVDQDGTPFPIAAVEGELNSKQYSQELQAHGGAFGDKLTYVLGFNFFRENQTQITAVGIFGGAPLVSQGQPDGRSLAGFAQINFDISEKLRLTAGGRFTRDKRQLTSTAREGSGACAIFDENDQPLPEPCINFVEETFEEPSYTVGFDYRPVDNVLLYLSHRRGYRSGGFTVLAARPIEFRPFDSEIVKDFEGGFKSDWQLGGMPVRTNLAIFYADYTNIQRTIVTVTPTGNFLQAILNAADATIKGGEFEFSMRPSRDLELSGYFAMSRARYGEFTNPFNGADLSANRFGAAPDYMGRIFADYRLPIIDDELGDIHLSGSWRWQSRTVFGDINELDVKQPNHGVADFRADWRNVGGTEFSVSAWITNAFNKDFIANGVPLKPSLGITPVIFGERRMIGFSVRYTFGN